MKIELSPKDRRFRQNLASISVASNAPGSRQRVKTVAVVGPWGQVTLGVDVQVAERSFAGDIVSLKVWKQNVGWITVPLTEVDAIIYDFEE